MNPTHKPMCFMLLSQSGMTVVADRKGTESRPRLCRIRKEFISSKGIFGCFLPILQGWFLEEFFVAVIFFPSFVMSVLPTHTVCVPCVSSAKGSLKRASDPLKSRVTDGCELQCGCWELIPMLFSLQTSF